MGGREAGRQPGSAGLTSRLSLPSERSLKALAMWDDDSFEKLETRTHPLLCHFLPASFLVVCFFSSDRRLGFYPTTNFYPFGVVI